MSVRQEMQPELGQTVLVRVTVGPDIIGEWSSASHRGVALTVEDGRVYIPWDKVVGMRWWFVTPKPEPAPALDGRNYEAEVQELSARITTMLNEEQHRAEARDVKRWRALSTELAGFADELRQRGEEKKAAALGNGQVITEEYTAVAAEIAARFLGEEWKDTEDG